MRMTTSMMAHRMNADTMEREDRGSSMAASIRSDGRAIRYLRSFILPPPSGARGLPVLFVAVALLAVGCNTGNERADAYGNFEATEVTVSAQQGGQLLRFEVEEGGRVQEDAPVGLVDTTQLALRRREMEAQREASRTRIDQVRSEMDVLGAELEVAETEEARIERLVEDEAATQQQLDGARGRVRVLTRRIQATRTQLRTVQSEIASIDAGIAQVAQQLEDARIVNPIEGVVLTTYAEPHELVAQGAPLYDVADLRSMYLRAYVSGAQLPHIQIGQPVTVLVDRDETENQALDGTVSWIADEAEFTPRTIQTKEERVNLVYAIKVRVPNPDGTLKIGMPGEVVFEHGSVGARGRGG